ncbi:MAG: nucleoside recognition protein [Legionellales bacterium]|nr:nucleoside recognition protein [Legionellales bacterium]
MLNFVWLAMMLAAVVCAVITGRVDAVVSAVTDYAKLAFEVALGLTGIMVFWLGLMKIAQQAGLITLLARAMQPILKRLFPEVPVDHPAMGAMMLNISANMLGLGNAATPFGLKAMTQLQRLNQHPRVASNAMCMFLAINTSSVQLIPTTAIAYLAAAGAAHPASIVMTALLATLCSTIAAIVAAKGFARLPRYRIIKEDE